MDATESKYAKAMPYFAKEMEALLTSNVATPPYLNEVFVVGLVGLVDLLPFMLPNYDMERDIMNGFMARMQEHRDLAEFGGNYNAWFLRKFMAR